MSDFLYNIGIILLAAVVGLLAVALLLVYRKRRFAQLLQVQALHNFLSVQKRNVWYVGESYPGRFRVSRIDHAYVCELIAPELKSPLPGDSIAFDVFVVRLHYPKVLQYDVSHKILADGTIPQFDVRSHRPIGVALAAEILCTTQAIVEDFWLAQ